MAQIRKNIVTIVFRAVSFRYLVGPLNPPNPRISFLFVFLVGLVGAPNQPAYQQDHFVRLVHFSAFFSLHQTNCGEAIFDKHSKAGYETLRKQTTRIQTIRRRDSEGERGFDGSKRVSLRLGSSL